VPKAGKGVFKASPRFGERFGEGLIYTLKTFKTSSESGYPGFKDFQDLEIV